jgi:hypothetical protein
MANINYLDLMHLPEGINSDDTHSLWVDIFKTIANVPPDESVIVTHAPWSWYPILYHFRCVINKSRRAFSDCVFVEGALSRSVGLSKRAVEVLSQFRPEVYEAINTHWDTPRARQYRKED